jgi:quinol monooxygenase YgiN
MPGKKRSVITEDNAVITHVVLLYPKAETSEQALTEALEHVRALQQVIAGLLSVSTGKNRSQYHQGYTYGIIMSFQDEASLAAHHPHPAHLAVVAELDALCERIIDFDLAENA